ncbi:MAG: DsbA family protein [Pseudomonadota bacterium]
MTDFSVNRRTVLGGIAAAGALGATGLRAQAAPEITEMIMGDPDAPVEVIEYASLTCPHCARFHTDVFPRLRENYIETGQVKFLFREVYFDRFGLWGGMLARCDESRYFGVIDLLLKQQAQWSRAGGPAEIVQAMRGIGAQAGLSAEQMEQCLSDRPMAEALVAQYQEHGREHTISGTPAFVIQGQMFGNMAYETFVERIEAALA